MDRDLSRQNRLLLIGASALLLLHAATYYPFLSDDALISLRYARRLIDGLGLTWTDGPPVEGYTNLLWVLLNAALGALGADLIWSARALGTAGALGAIAAVSWSPDTGKLDTGRLLGGGLVLAASAPLAIWAIGGLEQGLMAGLLAVALLLVFRVLERRHPRPAELWWAGAAFGMLALLRADGALLFGLTALGVVLCHGRRRWAWWLLMRLAVVPTLCVAGQLAFRLAYYGELVPNTARVKVGFQLARVWHGVEYVEHGALALNVLWLGVALGAWVTLRHAPRHRGVVPLVVSLGWSAYVALVGGDIFPGWRQLLPAIVPLTMLMAEGAQRSRLDSRRFRYLALVLLGSALAVYWTLQTREEANHRAKDERWEWAGEPLGDVLKRAFGPQQPLVAVDSAGALPYWSELPCVDMLGLNDKHIATHRPADFGLGDLAHELGDGAYVWRRRPDIVVFNHANGERDPKFKSGRQLLAQPDFHATYQLIRVWGNRGRTAVGEFYLRYEDGPLGIQRSDDSVRIPGYLLSYSVPSGARLDEREQLVTTIAGNAAGHVKRVRLAPGTWRVTPRPATPDAAVGFLCRPTLRASPRSAQRAATSGEPTIALERDTYVDIVVAAADGNALPLAEVLLSRDEQQKATHTCSPSGPQQVPLGALEQVRSPGTYYAFPGNEVIGRSGLHVVLPRRVEPAVVAIAVDGNDAYEIRFLLDQEHLGSAHLQPTPGHAGLLVARLEVPEDARAYGIDRIVILPSHGDGRYAVGHVRLEEQVSTTPSR